MNSDIEKNIANNVTFEHLPQNVRQLVGNSEKEYNKQVLEYSVKAQLQYRGNLVSTLVRSERSYYEQVIQSSRCHLMLYPYHLSESVVAGLRVSPFQYYCGALSDIMEQEKSYDALPNFTAVDVVRLLGVGRNQYIELMNQRKGAGKATRLFLQRRPGKELLPTLPAVSSLQHLQPWWRVYLGRVTQADVKNNVSAAEKVIIDLLIDSGSQLAATIDRVAILSLYSKGLIYLDVPLQSRDRVTVPPLEGFVMNRVTGDYMETLLYKVFVSIDEHSSVTELSSVLDIDMSLVKMALSLFCRLGFAQRKPPPEDGGPPIVNHPSWGAFGGGGGTVATPVQERTPEELLLQELESALNDDPSVYLERNMEAVHTHGGLLNTPHQAGDYGLPSTITPVDITASLHTPTAPRSFAEDAAAAAAASSLVSPTGGPGGCLMSPTPAGGINGSTTTPKRIAFLFDSTLTAFLMMGNLSPDLKNHAVTLFEVGKLPDEGLDSLMHELSKIPQCVSEGEAERYFTHALTLLTSLNFLRNNPALGHPGSSVDLVRWESLSHLDPATAARLLNKNYRLLVSMSPLHYSIPPLGPSTPPHYGPPSPPATSLWFRLLLYHTTASGPVTFLLPRGMRLRRIPKLLSLHRRVLVTGWGQEPSLLPLPQLLSTANDALTHYPIMIQGYGWQEEPLTHHVCLPLDDEDPWWGCRGVQLAIEKLHLRHAFGYLQLLAFPLTPSLTPPPSPATTQRRTSVHRDGSRGTEQQQHREGLELPLGGDTPHHAAEADRYRSQPWQVYDCHFGLPLFDARLNKIVSQKIMTHRLLAQESVEKFSSNQATLVKRLDAFIAQFQGASSAGGGEVAALKRRSGTVPLPTQPLLFDGGHLGLWDGH